MGRIVSTRMCQNTAIKCSILASVLLLYVYPLLLPTPLLDPDEGLHATIAQEMVETGDYRIPRTQGQPFLDKPIFYFLLQALSLRTFGMNEAAVRLPGLLCGLLGVATTYLLARRLLDNTTGLIAALVALTMTVPVALAQAPVHDIALVPWTNLLLLCWWEADHNTSRRIRLQLTAAAGFLVALALLTKGLIGLAVVSVGYFCFLTLSRQLHLAVVVRYAVSFLLGCLLACPWFLSLEADAPGYLSYYFIQRHFAGFTTATQLHGGEPWHYYLPILLGGAMPWTLHALPGLWPQRQLPAGRANTTSRAVAFTLCWLVGGGLFLSLASSKLITYCLPLFPAIAILAAHSVQLFLDRQLLPRLDVAMNRMIQLCCCVGVFLPTVAILTLDHQNGSPSPLVAHAAGVLAAVFSLSGLILVRSARRSQAIAVGALWTPLVFVALVTWPLQITAESYSQRSLGVQLAAYDRLPDKILLVGDRIGSVVFYLTAAQREQLQPGQLITAPADSLSLADLDSRHPLLVVKDTALSRIEDPLLQQLAQQTQPAAPFRLLDLGVRLAEHPRGSSWK